MPLALAHRQEETRRLLAGNAAADVPPSSSSAPIGPIGTNKGKAVCLDNNPFSASDQAHLRARTKSQRPLVFHENSPQKTHWRCEYARQIQ